jgi:hypothetical protein
LRYGTREHEARVSVNKRMRMRVSAGERTATGEFASTVKSHGVLGYSRPWTPSLCNTRPVGVRLYAWRLKGRVDKRHDLSSALSHFTLGTRPVRLL